MRHHRDFLHRDRRQQRLGIRLRFRDQRRQRLGIRLRFRERQRQRLGNRLRFRFFVSLRLCLFQNAQRFQLCNRNGLDLGLQVQLDLGLLRADVLLRVTDLRRRRLGGDRLHRVGPRLFDGASLGIWILERRGLQDLLRNDFGGGDVDRRDVTRISDIVGCLVPSLGIGFAGTCLLARHLGQQAGSLQQGLDVLVSGIDFARPGQRGQGPFGLASLEHHLAQPAVGLGAPGSGPGGVQQRRLGAEQVALEEPGAPFEHQQRLVGRISGLGADRHATRIPEATGHDQVLGELHGVFALRAGAKAQQSRAQLTIGFVSIFAEHIVFSRGPSRLGFGINAFGFIELQATLGEIRSILTEGDRH